MQNSRGKATLATHTRKAIQNKIENLSSQRSEGLLRAKVNGESMLPIKPVFTICPSCFYTHRYAFTIYRDSRRCISSFLEFLSAYRMLNFAFERRKQSRHCKNHREKNNQNFSIKSDGPFDGKELFFE